MAHRRDGLGREVAVALAFVVLAVAVRLPALQTIPRLTDETGEVAVALDIVHRGARPLVHNDAYRGPLWAYMLAGVVRVAGERPGLARHFALLLGALTVGATYALGRALAGRTAGAVAAALSATAFGPVALNSHVAWSNNSTPLWTTLAALLTWLAVGRPDAPRRPALLAAAGAAWGLALHTHPSVFAPLVGAVVWFMAAPERRARLATPGPWLALGAGLAVLAPLIVFNLRHDLATVDEALAPSQPVAEERGPVAVAGHLAGLAGQLGRSAGAGRPVEPGDPVPGALVSVTDALRPAVTAVYALALLGALALSALRGPRIVAALAGAGIAGIVLVNNSYVNFYDMRYVAFLLPLAHVALGTAVAPALTAGPRRRRMLAAAAVAALTLYPLLALGAFYARETAAGRTNGPLIAAADGLAAEARGAGHYVFVDKAMRPIKLGGGGDPARAFDHLLAFRRVPHELSSTDELRWFLDRDADTTFWVVAADDTATVLGAEFPLETRATGDGWLLMSRPGHDR